MSIEPMAVLAHTQSSGAAASSPASVPDNVDENQFLQLLVAQIRYQDPTNPTDSTTFVTQLAQFSSLEQLIAIRGDLAAQNTNNTTGGH